MFSRDCEHWPGELVDFPGSDEAVLVEIIWRDVRGEETSAVAFPAVHGTGVEEVRAALAESRQLEPIHHEDEDDMPDDNKTRLAELESQVEQQKAELASKDRVASGLDRLDDAIFAGQLCLLLLNLAFELG